MCKGLIAKKMKTLYLLIFSTLVLAACGNEEQKMKDQLLEQVMAAHDEVMPKMGDLRRTAKALQTIADSLSALTDQDYSARVNELREAAGRIENANDAMMKWMRQYEAPDNEAPIAEVLAYLKEQKEQIEKVRDEMLEALKAGEGLK